MLRFLHNFQFSQSHIFWAKKIHGNPMVFCFFELPKKHVFFTKNSPILAFQVLGPQPPGFLWVTSMALFLESCNLIPDHTGTGVQNTELSRVPKKKKLPGWFVFGLGIKGFLFSRSLDKVSSTLSEHICFLLTGMILLFYTGPFFCSAYQQKSSFCVCVLIFC